MALSVALKHRLGTFALDASFDVPNGVTALFGRSGAGKTSVINAVAGLITPQAGRICIQDQVVFDSAAGINVPAHKRGVGYVFQDARLFPHLSVSGNLSYAAKFGRAAIDDRLQRRIVDMLGIDHLMSRRPAGLSGGEKQRVAIARALLSSPRVLLMDEPLAALDPARKAEILPYLETLRDELDMPILYVSHAVSEIARLADQVVLMQAGQVVANDTTAAVFADADLAPSLGLRDAGAVIMGRVVAHDPDGLTHLSAAGGHMYLPQIQAPIGATIRLRILAQDVTLMRDAPQNISALNIVSGTILAVRRGDGPGAIVTLQCGQDLILARVTGRSVDAMGLQAGIPCYAVVKSVSVSPDEVGHH